MKSLSVAGRSLLNFITKPTKKKQQREVPAISDIGKTHTGRRARQMVTVYRVEDVAPKLTDKKPFFQTDPAHVYALQANASGLKRGEPTGAFVRVNKNRKIKGKQRKADRRTKRALLREAEERAGSKL